MSDRIFYHCSEVYCDIHGNDEEKWIYRKQDNQDIYGNESFWENQEPIDDNNFGIDILLAYCLFCIWGGWCIYPTGCVWKTEELSLSLYHVVPEDQTQVVRLGGRVFSC